MKRVIGEPGDLVAIADGKVTVNNRTLDEPYLDFLGHTDMHAVRLAGDEYFVLGDNRTGSRDSRHWGPLPEDHIIGKVWGHLLAPVSLGVSQVAPERRPGPHVSGCHCEERSNVAISLLRRGLPRCARNDRP